MRTLVLGADAKRLHLAHEMRRAADGTRAAAQELMYLHIDLGARRVTPWPAALHAGLAAAAAAHRGLDAAGLDRAADRDARRSPRDVIPLAAAAPTRAKDRMRERRPGDDRRG